MTISTFDDWQGFCPEVIIDSMIYRAADMFLTADPRADQAPTPWEAVSKDIGGLVYFFDLLVLHERVPGATIGAVAGVVTEEAINPVVARLWGFVFAQLPFASARKLLMRAAHADFATMSEMEGPFGGAVAGNAITTMTVPTWWRISRPVSICLVSH